MNETISVSAVRVLAERGQPGNFVKELVKQREWLQANYSFLSEKSFALTLAEYCQAVCRYDEDEEAYIFTGVGC